MVISSGLADIVLSLEHRLAVSSFGELPMMFRAIVPLLSASLVVVSALTILGTVECAFCVNSSSLLCPVTQGDGSALGLWMLCVVSLYIQFLTVASRCELSRNL